MVGGRSSGHEAQWTLGQSPLEDLDEAAVRVVVASSLLGKESEGTRRLALHQQRTRGQADWCREWRQSTLAGCVPSFSCPDLDGG